MAGQRDPRSIDTIFAEVNSGDLYATQTMKLTHYIQLKEEINRNPTDAAQLLVRFQRFYLYFDSEFRNEDSAEIKEEILTEARERVEELLVEEGGRQNLREVRIYLTRGGIKHLREIDANKPSAEIIRILDDCLRTVKRSLDIISAITVALLPNSDWGPIYLAN